jgi:hypothetical protein
VLIPASEETRGHGTPGWRSCGSIIWRS